MCARLLFDFIIFNRRRRTTVASQARSCGGEASVDGMVRYYDIDDDDNVQASRIRYSEGSGSMKKQTSSFAARPHFSVRMTRRNVLFAERKRLSDYALVFGVIGIALMILETELNMARVYDKVLSCRFTFACCVLFCLLIPTIAEVTFISRR